MSDVKDLLVQPESMVELKKMSINARGANLAKLYFQNVPDILDKAEVSLEPVSGGSIKRSTYLDRVAYIATNGFKSDKYSCHAKDTILVFEGATNNKTTPKAIEKAIGIYISNFYKLLREDQIYSYNAERKLTSVVQSVRSKFCGKIFISDQGLGLPCSDPACKAFPENERATALYTSFLREASKSNYYGGFVTREEYSHYASNRNQSDNQAIGDLSLVNHELESYFAWIEAGMPYSKKWPWLKYIFEYSNGLEMAFVMNQNTDEEMINALVKNLRNIMGVLKTKIDASFKDLYFSECGDGLFGLFYILSMLYKQLLMLCSLKAVEDPKLFPVANLWKVSAVLEESRALEKALRKASSEKALKDCELKFQLFNYKGNNTYDNASALGLMLKTEVDASKEYLCSFIRGTIQSIICRINDDADNLKKAVLSKLFEYNSYDKLAKEAFSQGVIEQLTAGVGFNARKLLTVRKRTVSILSTFSGRVTCFNQVVYSFGDLSNYGEVFWQNATFLFEEYKGLSTKVFGDENDIQPDYENLTQKEKEVIFFRRYLQASAVLRIYLKKPDNPFRSFLRTKKIGSFKNQGNHINEVYIASVEELAKLATINAKLGAAQIEVLETALNLWGLNIYPMRIATVKRNLSADSKVVIYQEEADEALNEQQLACSGVKINFDALTFVLLRFYAGSWSLSQKEGDLTSSNLLQAFSELWQSVEAIPEWVSGSMEAMPNYGFEYRKQCELCALFLKAKGVEAYDTLWMTSAKELTPFKGLLCDAENEKLLVVWLQAILMLATKSLIEIPPIFVNLIGLLVVNYFKAHTLKALIPTFTLEHAEELLNGVGSSASAITKLGAKIISQFAQAHHVSFRLYLKRKNSAKKANKAELDKPIALNIDETRLKNVLKTTEEARESLDRIFAESVDDTEDAQVASVAQNLRTMRHAGDDINSQGHDAQTSKAPSRAKASNAQGDTTLKENSTNKFSLEAINEIYDIIAAKEVWQESDLRRAYGKRPVMLAKFIDAINALALKLYDDYAIYTEDGEIEVVHEYLMGTKPLMIQFNQDYANPFDQILNAKE